MEHLLYRYCAIVLTAVVGLLGYTWVDWAGLDASDWAAWFGAIGTIGAVAGAIWIAGEQERYRRTENMTIARLVAAGMGNRMIMIQGDVKRAILWLEIVEAADGAPEGFLELQRLLAAIPTVAQEDMVRLTPLPRHCAYKMAAGFDRLHAAQKFLALAIDSSQLSVNPQFRKSHAGYIVLTLRQAYECFEMVIDQLQIATTGLTRLDD